MLEGRYAAITTEKTVYSLNRGDGKSFHYLLRKSLKAVKILLDVFPRDARVFYYFFSLSYPIIL